MALKMDRARGRRRGRTLLAAAGLVLAASAAAAAGDPAAAAAGDPAAGEEVVEEEFVWTRQATWLVLVQGSEENPDTPWQDVEAAREALESTILRVCEEHGLEEERCSSVERQLTLGAAQSTVDEERFVPVTIDHVVSASMSLRDPEGALNTVTLQIGIEEEPMEKTQAFCQTHEIALASCQSLANQTLEAWRTLRQNALSGLRQRFETSVGAMSRLEEGSGTWKDVVLTKHHLSSLLAVNRHHWQAWYVLGSLYSMGASNYLIAGSLKATNSTQLLESAVACFEEGLRSLQRESDVELEQARLLTLSGTALLHLDKVHFARERLTVAATMSKSRLDEDASKEWMTMWREAFVMLLTLEANVGGTEALRALLRDAQYPASLSEAEKHALEMFGLTSFPFVLESEDTARSTHASVLRELDRLLVAAKADPERSGDLHPYYSFYSVYAGALESPGEVRDLRVKLGALHRKSTPSLNFVSERLQAPATQGAQNLTRKVRVGFVSSFLYDHSVGKLMCGTIEALVATGQFEIVVVQVGNTHLASARPGDCKSMWGAVEDADHAQGALLDVALTADGIAAAMRSLDRLELDVAIFGEVGLTAATYFLAFGRVAPVQAAFWGHPLTTGVGSSMDYVITSRKFLPSDGDMPAFPARAGVGSALLCPSEMNLWGNLSWVPFTETVVCTETLGTKFAMPEAVREADEEEARRVLSDALRAAGWMKPIEDTHLYYLPHKLMKLHPRMDTHLRAILDQDPSAVLVFSSGEAADSDAFSVFVQGRRALASRLAVDASRMIWLPALPKTVFLAVGRLASAVLESFGSFGSGVTALELTALGVPMVCMPNSQLVGPNAFGLYRQIIARLETNAGQRDRVAAALEPLACMDATSSCFVDTALRLARDAEFYEHASRALVEHADLVYEDDAAVHEWVALLEFMGAERAVEASALTMEVEGLQPAPAMNVQHEDPVATEASAAAESPQFVPHMAQFKDTFRSFMVSKR